MSKKNVHIPIFARSEDWSELPEILKGEGVNCFIISEWTNAIHVLNTNCEGGVVIIDSVFELPDIVAYTGPLEIIELHRGGVQLVLLAKEKNKEIIFISTSPELQFNNKLVRELGIKKFFSGPVDIDELIGYLKEEVLGVNA